jgi:hypothetical protein
VIRLLLEAYYEPQFSVHSHGFRPGRGCHSALSEVANTWTGTTWFVEGDLADCFGSLDHQVLLDTLGEKIHDARFLALLRNMLKAGYLEDWVWNATMSGAPQGGVASPILSNVYLHGLDRFVETVLIPQYTRGERRARNPAYVQASNALARARRQGDEPRARQLRKQLRRMPSQDPGDPGYRRLRYVRYADDILLGFIGPKAEAEEIKSRLGRFLREELKLELSEPKTLITHARTGAARFLGYEISVAHNDTKMTAKRRSLNGGIRLSVPAEVISAKCRLYMRRGRPAHRSRLINEDDYTIIGVYGSEYRGVVQYYLLAGDVYRLNRLHWVMRTSMLKTLAAKHNSSVAKMAHRYRGAVETPHGPRACLQVSIERPSRKPLVARFGGIPLKRQSKAVIYDRQPVPVAARRRQLITRLLAGICEICGSTDRIEVHQVRKLADLARLGQPSPIWAQLMAKRRRKTLVVCATCHQHAHVGPPIAAATA